MAISNSTLLEIRDVFISKVVLENFLSFEKDEVDFGNSKFNLIIGPNWSGKTSIFQAIKFGLGSNERDERYSRWADFIRIGQKHARVELHVHDKGKNIIIQRTVIRGKSPYYAIKKWDDKNFRKTPTIEVQKLIKDLNFNPDNHFAFVSQGKVDAIKNLKPIELCTFLEEGIGLRGLREEILQQKNNVSALHLELNSIVTQKNTLNISLDLLRPKLERLEKKKKLLEVRKIHADELLWANRKTLEKEISTLEEIMVKIKVQADILNFEVKKCKQEIDEFKTKIAEIEKNINQHSKKLGELDYKKKDLIKTIQDWQRDKIKAKQDLDDSAEVIGKKEKVLKNFESQKESLDKEITQINKKKGSLESKFDELLKEQSELTIKIERNKEFLEKYEQKILEKNERNKKIIDNQKIIKDTTTEINQIFQSLNDIDHKLDNNNWFLENPTKNLLRTFDNELGKVSAKIFSLDHAIDQMEKDKARKMRQLKPLQSSLRERKVVLPTNITILKEEINKRELRAKGPIIDYLKYDDELSYAIESVIGEKLLYSFVAEDWDTLTLLKKLKNKYSAYCNIYVPKNLNVSPLMNITGKGVVGYLAELVKIMDDDADIKKVIYSKVKNCLVMKDFTSGQELYKNGGFKGKCVTLKGEQIISYKYVFETPHVKQLKGLLSAGTQKEQSKNLESEIKTLSDTISERKIDQSKLDGIQREIFKKKEAFNDLLYNFNQKQRLTNKKNQLYEYNYAFEENISVLQKEIEEIEVKIVDLETQKDPEFFKINDRIKKIPKDLSNLNEKKKKWATKLEENQKILVEINEKVNSHKNEINLLRQEHDKRKGEFQKADKEAFKIYQELEIVEDEIDSVEKRIINSTERVKEIRLEMRDLDKKNIQLSLDLEQEKIKLNSTKRDFESKKDDLKRLDNQLGKKKEFKSRPIEDIKEDLLKIEKQLLQYMDVDETLLVERDQILVGLKKIAKNQQDLENDIKAAKKTEVKLEKTYFNKFKVVLDNLKSKINEKFESSQIKSHCSLELNGDFEELGINIKAATSIEQLKSCTALSGGQISMISICLMLSLQEIKPSPLCMFDEAGMFLDDKNSDAANQLIKSTLEQNPIQMIMFLPKTSSSLYNLAENIIGVARVGKNEVSTIFKPKIIKSKK